MKKIHFFLLFILISLAILTRLFFLDLRPLHHDEGVNYNFAADIMRTGEFIYNPLNYHGPLYFFLLFASFTFFGVSEFALRFPAAVFGILLALITFFLKKREERFSKYAASIFLIFSPSILYYSRYSIHEMAFAFFSFLSFYLLSIILEKKDLTYLPFLVLALAFLVTTKETAIIIFTLLFIFFILHIKEFRQIRFQEEKKTIILSFFLFFLLYAALFTSFFSHPKGFLDSFISYTHWISRGYSDIGHFKPWYYYLWLLFQYELPILLFALGGLWHARKYIFTRGIAIWFLGDLLIYSMIKYKMPWVVINITAPLAILAGVGYKHFPIGITWKRLMLCASILYLFFFSLWANVWFPWQNFNQFAYVHSHPDVQRLSKQLKAIAKQDDRVLIVSAEYWPLPFYLNGRHVEYLNEPPSFNPSSYQNFQIFIVRDTLLSSSPPEGFIQEKYTLRNGIILALIYKNR